MDLCFSQRKSGIETALFTIWKRLAESILYEDNRNTRSVFHDDISEFNFI